MTTFDGELQALRIIYEALRPFPIHERDRIVRMVQDRLARERSGGAMRFRGNPEALEDIVLGLPDDAA